VAKVIDVRQDFYLGKYVYQVIVGYPAFRDYEGLGIALLSEWEKIQQTIQHRRQIGSMLDGEVFYEIPVRNVYLRSPNVMEQVANLRGDIE
jgi:hypothetical protein